MGPRTEGFRRLNERGNRRGRIEPWIIMGLMILWAFFMFRSMTLGQRIEKAKDLLGDDPQRIATPARLYNILNGTDDLEPQIKEGKPQ